MNKKNTTSCVIHTEPVESAVVKAVAAYWCKHKAVLFNYQANEQHKTTANSPFLFQPLP